MNNRLPLDRLKNKHVITEKVGLEPLSAPNDAQLKKLISGRIVEAFGTDVQTHIADRVGGSLASVRLYVDGSRFPSIEFLVQAHRATGVSIHWLITGEGPKFPELKGIFSPEEENQISELAKKSKRTFLQEVRRLALAGKNAIIDYLDSV